MYVHRAITDRDIAPAGLLEQARARHDAPSAAHQGQEQVELDSGEVGQLAVDGHLAGAHVQADAADIQVLLARVELGAAQHGAQSGPSSSRGLKGLPR